MLATKDELRIQNTGGPPQSLRDSSPAQQGSQLPQSLRDSSPAQQGSQPSQSLRDSSPAQQGSQTTPQAAATGSTTPQGSQSAVYNNTMAALRQAQGLGAGFTGDYDTEIARLYDEIANREKFSYDYSTDPLYAQYKQSYQQAGQEAMRDTVGQGAALTGGYANSYAQTAGQQQYDAYLSRLNEVLPELYSNAYNVYQSEGDRLNQLYALTGEQRDNAYQRYRDALGDANYNDALSIQQAMDRAALGDWAAYADMYGTEAAKRAAILSNPQAAWASGLATGEEVKAYTGKYPVGYTPKGVGVSKAASNPMPEWNQAWQDQINAAHQEGMRWTEYGWV